MYTTDEDKRVIDAEFWVNMPGWTIAEGAALLLDIDPDEPPEPSAERDSLGWKYHRLLRTLVRAGMMEELPEYMAPKSFLLWASSNKLVVPQDLETMVRKGKTYRNWRTRYAGLRRERDKLLLKVAELEQRTEEPNSRAKASYLVLIAAVVREKFKAGRNLSKTVAVLDTIGAAGGSLARNTVDTILSEAEEYFDEKFPAHPDVLGI